MSGSAPALVDVLRAAVRDAIGDLDPALLVHKVLPPLPPKQARVRVVAAGKAAAAMARGAAARWGDRIEDILVVTVDEAQSCQAPPLGKRTTTLHAAHPVADERSVTAALEALERAGPLGAKDLLLALISGGTSALLSLPPEGLGLAAKSALVARLLEQGAPIQDINLVRRHLSRIKGGRLALAAAPARVLTLILSDVIEGKPHDVGSGPTAADPTDVVQARHAVMRYAPDLAATVSAHMSESLKPGTQAIRTRARMVATPDDLARAVALRLEHAGLHVERLRAEQGDAAVIAQRRVALAHRLSPGQAVVVACEPTIRLAAHRGHGGRCGWIALAAMRRLPDGVVLLCGASDGVDGSSGAAGAVVTRAHAQALDSREVDAVLAEFNDAELHRKLGTALTLGPTGHNLTDVHILARQP